MIEKMGDPHLVGHILLDAVADRLEILAHQVLHERHEGNL